MRKARALSFLILAGCGSSFVVAPTTDGDAGSGTDGGNEADGSTDATTTSAGDAGADASGDGEAMLDDGAVTDAMDGATDAALRDGGPWTSLPFPASGPGGIAVANGQLYYASSTGVDTCLLPDCPVFSPAYPGLAATALTANATSTRGFLAWLSGDGGVIDVTDTSGTKQAFPAAAPAGTYSLQLVFGLDDAMFVMADALSGGGMYESIGLGNAANPASMATLVSGTAATLAAGSRTLAYRAAFVNGDDPTGFTKFSAIGDSMGAHWEAQLFVDICPDGGPCAHVDALAAHGADAVVYAVVNEGASDAILLVAANGSVSLLASGLPSPIDRMYKYAGGLAWTHGKALYGCTNAVTACAGGLIGTASAPFDAITSDDAFIYVEVPQAPGTIERFAVPHFLSDFFEKRAKRPAWTIREMRW